MAYRFQNDKCMIETAKKVLAVDKRCRHNLYFYLAVPLSGPLVQ